MVLSSGGKIAEDSQKKIVLTGDIGGTNANFCIAGFNNFTPEILLKKTESTTSVEDFSVLINDFLAYAKEKKFEPEVACFAVAGPVENLEGYQRVKMTNTKLLVDSKELIENTTLKKVLLIPDITHYK